MRPTPPGDPTSGATVSGTVSNPAPVPMLLTIPALEVEDVLQPGAVATISASAPPGRYAYTLRDPASDGATLDGILVLDPAPSPGESAPPPRLWSVQTGDVLSFIAVLVAAACFGYSNAQPEHTADTIYYLGAGILVAGLYPLRRFGCLTPMFIVFLYAAALLISIPITDALT